MITAIAITKNEEANIARCLRSVQWADEIIVVDAESTDRTAEIARSLNAKVIVRPWEGFAKQKEFAFRQASHDWIFSIDADEEVTPELREEIRTVITAPHPLNGYEVPRRSFFLGKWIRYGGWYPGYQLRLFRAAQARMNHRPVHEGFLVEGIKGVLRSDLNHYTYNSIHQYIEKMNDYSSLDVLNKLSTGRVIRWYHFLLNPLSAFLRMFVSLKGWKDGMEGFLLAYYSAVHTLAIFAKCWEYQSAQRQGGVLPPVTPEAVAE
ncbi:MAG: glycosyltransferase family 2 protein, partial [Bacteroidetes bacterium]|nr:glycosyltransferase family 2 protein [Bacteroidota bacterium]